MIELDVFTRAYLECALWSSTDDNGVPLDQEHTIEDIESNTLGKLVSDCEAFQRDNMGHIIGNLEQAGHDFWLTRNGHGAGFWDGDWRDDLGKILTDRSEAFGQIDLYIGDDGKIYA